MMGPNAAEAHSLAFPDELLHANRVARQCLDAFWEICDQGHPDSQDDSLDGDFRRTMAAVGGVVTVYQVPSPNEPNRGGTAADGPLEANPRFRKQQVLGSNPSVGSRLLRRSLTITIAGS
jgi:hypothetical protein